MSALVILILGSNILQGLFWTVLMEKLLKEKKHTILNNIEKLIIICLGMAFIFANLKGQKIFAYFNTYDFILVMVMSILLILCFHYNQFILKKMLLSIMIVAVTATTVLITGVVDTTLIASISFASWIITIMYVLCNGILNIRNHYTWNWDDSDVKVYTVTAACGIYSIIKIVTYYDKVINEKMDLVRLWMCGLIGVSLVLYYIVGSIYDSYEKMLEKKLVELSYEQNEYSADNIRHMYEEAGKMRHDIKNCITIVDNCIANEDYDDARKYMSSLVEEKVDALGINIYCSNKVLNYIINHKFAGCQKKKIETKCIISTNLERISDVDLSILIGNLLDNAIEAAQKFAEGRMVAIEIYEESGSTTIIVENTISESVMKNNHTFVTTKQDKSMHGFGMISIRDIVNKYRGSIEYSEDGNVLSCQVVLNENSSKSSYY